MILSENINKISNGINDLCTREIIQHAVDEVADELKEVMMEKGFLYP